MLRCDAFQDLHPLSFWTINWALVMFDWESFQNTNSKSTRLPWRGKARRFGVLEKGESSLPIRPKMCFSQNRSC